MKRCRDFHHNLNEIVQDYNPFKNNVAILFCSQCYTQHNILRIYVLLDERESCCRETDPSMTEDNQWCEGINSSTLKNLERNLLISPFISTFKELRKDYNQRVHLNIVDKLITSAQNLNDSQLSIFWNHLRTEFGVTYRETLQNCLSRFVEKFPSQSNIPGHFEKIGQHNHINSQFCIIQKTSEENICSICCVDYLKEDLCVKLPCTHCFHSKCIDRWIFVEKSCPLCRKKFK